MPTEKMIKTLALTGPTASGKTGLSIGLAKALSAEIISSDSMQIYRGMNIGTAKATEEERGAVRHHLIDFLSPNESYSQMMYREAAISAAKEIANRGKLPFFVGGTGLYLDALMRAPSLEVPESSPEYKSEILSGDVTEAQKEELWQRLLLVDPESAEKIHKNNLRRVVRALEIYDTTGKPKSYFDKLSRERTTELSVGMITIDFHNRENLYSRVDQRVDEMIKEGLENEVRGLLAKGYLSENTTAAQAIGYKEMISYIKGGQTLDSAIEEIKLSTRRYAKRQLTWFRHVTDAKRLYADGENGEMKTKEQLFEEALASAKELFEREI